MTANRKGVPLEIDIVYRHMHVSVVGALSMSNCEHLFSGRDLHLSCRFSLNSNQHLITDNVH